MILLMSATANTIISFIIGLGSGALGIAWWYGRESKKHEDVVHPADTKIIYISGDIETSIVEPNISDWKKAAESN